MSLRWLAHAERSNAFFLLLIGHIAMRIGRPAARALLFPITLYYLLTAHAERKASRVFLSRVLGRRATLWDAARHIHTFACTLVDRVYCFTGRFEQLDVRFHNTELPLKTLSEGKGGILLGSHLGSFEVMRAKGLLDQKIPLKILMHRDHNKVITGLLNALDPRFAESVIELTSPTATLEIHASLAKGDFVGMLGDRPSGDKRVTRCRFFGRETSFPAGAVILGHVCKVPIIMFFGLYKGGNRYDVHFELLAERVVLSRAHRERDIQRLMQRYAETLEKYTRLEPFNWFNFYDYWDEYSPER